MFTVIDTKQSLAPTCVHTLYSAAPIDSMVIFFCSLLTTGDYLLNNGVLLSLMAVARREGCVLEHAPACCLDVLTSQCTIRPRWHFTLVAFLLFISQPLFSLVTVSFIFHLSSRSLTCLSVCIKIVSEPSQFTNRLTSAHIIVSVSVFSSYFPLSPLLITHHLECDRTAHFHVNSHSFVCFLLLFQCTIRSQSPQARMHFEPLP